MKLTTRARVPPIQVAKNIKRMLDVFFVRNSIFLIAKVWLNHLLDDHKLNNITKLKKKKEKKEEKKKKKREKYYY